MGKETQTTARYKRTRAAGRLQLETDDLRFRSDDLKLTVPLKQIATATAENGVLRVVWPEGDVRFELGAAATKWADQINNPKSLLDKLGVKPGLRVSLASVQDQGFLVELEQRMGQVSRQPVKDSDIIFFQADEPNELSALNTLKGSIARDGAIWVITPKKRPEIADTIVMKAGKAAGLVDVKVARFSETYTALKFVIPRDQR